MHPIFHIKSSEIKALNDGQARELVARLCKAELLAREIGADAVTWGGDQRAKDGGVDVRVEIAAGVRISGYIPKVSTIFQVKAEHFGKAKISAEMAPKGLLRPAIRELAEKSGAYLIVSTKDALSDSSRSERIQAMADCMDEHRLGGRVVLDFYDSRKIADWTENNPAIAVWVRNEAGGPLEGWKSYGPWAYLEKSLDDEYLLDRDVKVLVPNTEDEIEVIEAMNRLRGDLSKDRSSVRIVGLSGVGKTRLVQALFDNRITTTNASLDQGIVLYTDLSANPTPQPTAMLEALIHDGSTSIVVVDNCGQNIHLTLTEIAKRADSKIRLLTVEYDIQDHLPDGTACYRLEGASSEIIGKLLRRNFKNLSGLDIEKIVEFSGGNARVAFSLASTSEAKGELAQLRDDELFRRLFNQKHTESDELQRCAEAASLLYSFDVDDTSEQSELAVLSAVAEVSIDTFYRNVFILKSRGLIQERGRWRAVLPHAISNRLALNAVQSNHPARLAQRLVTTSSERVARSFSRRLGYLHESKHAKQIVDDWLTPDGPLGDVSNLSELWWTILENVSPVNQRAVLNALRRAVEIPDFIAIANTNRSKTGRLLRSLAYDIDLFDDGAAALTTFALEEPEHYESDPIRDILQSLFYPHFSGTLALPEQRAAFVRTLAFSGDPRKSKLALHLLRAGLESRHFSSHYGFDFGALKRGYGWHPKTREEILGWYGLFIQIAIDLGKTATALGSDVRAILGGAFSGLWSDSQMDDELTRAARELAPVDGWPDGWIGIRNTLRWNQGHINLDSLDRLKALERELSPKDLQAKIQAKVLSSGSFGAELDDFDPDSPSDSLEKTREEARTLGNAAAQDSYALADLAPFISNGNTTNKVFIFAIGVGQASDSVQGILERLRTLIERYSVDGFDPQFIAGLINGWHQNHSQEVAEFLDKAVDDEVWGPLFPYLQLAVELDQSGYLRLIESLKIGRASSSKYANLCYGRRAAPLSAVQVYDFLSLLSERPDGGLFTAIEVLYMVIHGTDTKDEQYKADLHFYSLKFVENLDWSLIDFANVNFLHHLERVIFFSLDRNGRDGAVAGILHRLIQQECSGGTIFPRHVGRVLIPFFKKYPIQALDSVYSKSSGVAMMRMLTVSRLLKFGRMAMRFSGCWLLISFS